MQEAASSSPLCLYRMALCCMGFCLHFGDPTAPLIAARAGDHRSAPMVSLQLWMQLLFSSPGQIYKIQYRLSSLVGVVLQSRLVGFCLAAGARCWTCVFDPGSPLLHFLCTSLLPRPHGALLAFSCLSEASTYIFYFCTDWGFPLSCCFSCISRGFFHP